MKSPIKFGFVFLIFSNKLSLKLYKIEKEVKISPNKDKNDELKEVKIEFKSLKEDKK